MRTQPILLESELKLIRRSPAVAGDGPSLVGFAEGKLSLQLISNNQIAVKKMTHFLLLRGK